MMVSAGEEPLEANELRELELREDADEARRKDVRRPEGEKRERMELKREDCILTDFLARRIFFRILGAIEADCRLLARLGARRIAFFHKRFMSIGPGECRRERKADGCCCRYDQVEFWIGVN